MNATPDLVALIQREREARIHEDRLAAMITCVRTCCDASIRSRIARALRGTPATC